MDGNTTAAVQTQQTAGTTSVTLNTWSSDWKVLSVSALLTAAMLWLTWLHAAAALTFQEHLPTMIPGIFSSMLIISLLVERVIEVFVSLWCDPQTAVHQQNLNYWKGRQGHLKRHIQALIAERDNPQAPADEARKQEINKLLTDKYAKIEEANANADNEEKALLPFQARTQKVAIWIGLVVGVFTSAVGFRFLSQIVILDDAFKNTSQFHWFVVADVLLTGAVLAGGSKLVHQIFSIYEAFMGSTQKLLSAKGATGTG